MGRSFDIFHPLALNRPWWIRYGIALPAVAFGVGLRFVLAPYVPPSAPFLTFAISVMLSAWYGGFGPGLVTIFISVVVGDYLYIQPTGSFALDPFNAAKMMIFTGVGLLISLLGALIQRTRDERASAVRSMQLSEERFAASFNASPHGMAMYSVDKRAFTMTNARFCEILGYSPGEIIGRDWLEFRPFVSDVERHTIGDSLRHQRRILDHILRVRNRNGEVIVLSVSIAPATLRDERLLVLNIEDVTERRLAQESVAESERKYREIVEGTNAMLFTTDRRGRFTYLNDAAAFALGHRPAELGGRFYLRYVHPDDRAWVHGVYTRQLSRAQETSYMEFRYVARNGTEGWLSFSVSPVLEGNSVIGLSGVAQEISRRKKTEAALRASEEQHRLLFETMKQGVIYIDDTGEIILSNPSSARLLGLRDEEVLSSASSHSRLKVVHEDGSPMQPEELPSLVALKEGREVRNVRLGLVPKAGGEVRWLEVSAIPQVREGESAPYRVYITFDDITAQRIAEERIRNMNVELELRVQERTEQLSQANKELESFSYSISHDLRAPLRAVNGFSRILAEDHGAALDKDGHRLLDNIAESARQMGQLIDDLLRFSQLNRGPLEKKVVDVGAMVIAIVHELSELEKPRFVDVSLGELGFPAADPSLLRQAWVNLIANAFKFTRGVERPFVRIESRVESGFLVYSISDNGAGFDMRYADKLFGVFQRLHSVDEFEGTGIGLALVQRIIHRHGGKVWADAAVDEGATFYFSLPLD